MNSILADSVDNFWPTSDAWIRPRALQNNFKKGIEMEGINCLNGGSSHWPRGNDPFLRQFGSILSNLSPCRITQIRRDEQELDIFELEMGIKSKDEYYELKMKNN